MAMRVFETLTQHCPHQSVAVHLLPTAGNPFKGTPTLAHHRLQMLSLATQNLPIEIDTYEVHQTPPTYTIDTVKYLKKRYPNDRRILIMGQDSFEALPTWRDGDKINDWVDIWVFARAGSTRMNMDKYRHLTDFLAHHSRVYFDETPIPAISSTQIRTWLAAQQEDRQLECYVDNKVLAYIKLHNLY